MPRGLQKRDGTEFVSDKTIAPKYYCVDQEVMLLQYPKKEDSVNKVRAAIRAGTIQMLSDNPQSWESEFSRIVASFEKEAQDHYYAIKLEFQKALEAKYGGFESYMTHKHGLNKYTPAIQAIIHGEVYSRYHSGGNSEMDNGYHDVTEFVDRILSVK